MAHALIDEHNQIFLIAESTEELQLQYPHYGLYENNHSGRMITISQEDFDALQDGSKKGSFNGTNLVLENTNYFFNNQEQADQLIESKITQLNNSYNRFKSNAFGVKINNYKTVLTNLDTSTISYPYNGTIEQYLKSQGHSIVGYLQIH